MPASRSSTSMRSAGATRRRATPCVRSNARCSVAGGAAGRDALVVRAGSRAHVGPADVHLESGSVIAIDRELPVDLPLGYHELVGRGRPAAATDRGSCGVSSAGGSRYVGLGDSALRRALAPQLGHRRSRRSALAGPLGARAGGRHCADQSAGRAGADDSAAAQSVFPFEPPFSQPAVSPDRGSGRRARRRTSSASSLAPPIASIAIA